MTLPPAPELSRSDEAELSPADLRAWAARMADALEDERLRMARDLHDDLGQLLSALKLEVAGLAKVVSGPGTAERIAAMNALINDTIVAVRRISNHLRPLLLDDLGLNSAVESLARTAAERMGIEITVRHDEQDPPVQPSMATALYRMVQEALTNIARHAKATRVQVQLRCGPDELLLVVRDNGIGFGEQAMHRDGSHGLMGIRERARILGGQLEIGEAAGGGGRLAVRLPMQRAAGAAVADDESPGTRT